MSRIAWLLAGLSGILLAVLWWFLLYAPTAADIEELRTGTERAEDEAADLHRRAEELERVRAEAPELEADLTAFRVLVPDGPALSALLRQAETASVDAGVLLRSVNPSSPSPVETELPGVVAVGVTMDLEGSYFQIVDFLRRLEDPAVTGRAVKWRLISLNPIEFPVLQANVSGTVYGRLEADDAPLAPDPDGEVDEAEDADPDAEDELLDDAGVS